MSPTSPIGSPEVQPSSLPPKAKTAKVPRFPNLRSVQWRIFLGILSSSPSASIEDYRRGAAESRRRYAKLRRRLLIDPHQQKDGNSPIDLALDNPLSQNPESTWSRFFRNAELEKTLDQDLSRLYPEHGSYFQSSECQALLRRVLLVWCLRHPEYGYRQGMHELLAPLLYVLHIDIQHHFVVRRKHEDHFTDEFEGISFPEGDMSFISRFNKSVGWSATTDGAQTRPCQDDLDPETRDVILLSDAYGAEGELGVVLSDRFMEHDAYCIFDALMSGSSGIVVMAEFFSPSPLVGSNAFLPPIIEASSALYHLLSIVDSPLHSHLVELGVEPHYFAMRWLRVLFGREFSLKDLLIVWDEIFSHPNGSSYLKNGMHQHFKILSSPRGIFIAAMAVSMILHLRSSLLATEHATSCLQKLLNFPENIDVKKLIGKARSLQAMAFNDNASKSPIQGTDDRPKTPKLIHSRSLGAFSPKAALFNLPESYWEEKWRVMQKEEPVSKEKKSKSISNGIIKRLRAEKLKLFRTESVPSSSEGSTTNEDSRPPVKRNLLEDLSRESASTIQVAVSECKTAIDVDVVSQLTREAFDKNYAEDLEQESMSDKPIECKVEVASSVGENSSCFSASSSPVSVSIDHENEPEDGHVVSISNTSRYEEVNSSQSTTISVSDPCATPSSSTKYMPTKGVEGDCETLPKEKKAIPSKFQWFWKSNKSSAEANVDKGRSQSPKKSETIVNSTKVLSPSVSDGSKVTGKTDGGDIGTLKNLGTSMLENIQVLESVFQQEPGQSNSLENLSSNILGGKGQAAAMAALRELRKISSLLSEM